MKKNQTYLTFFCRVLFMFSILYGWNGFSNIYTPNTFSDPIINSVNNSTGQINGGATISLRSALMAADNLGGTHTVNLSSGTYNLTLALPNRQITIGNTAQNITINGNGPANTIINMTNDANRDRIMTINYNGTTPNVITTISGVKFQNGYLTSDEYGGAAIYAGPVGGFLETLTLTNCAFDNNICPSKSGNGGVGGAIYMFQETITINNCTFTNNSSVDGVGGAIFFTLYNNQGNNGNVNITNSTFSGNSARELGGAIHITSQGAQPGGVTFTTNINNNTFLNNSTTVGLGGGIALNNGANLSVMQVHFNRFYNNTSTSSALSSGLHFVESSGSVNAENNWWGCNSNPTGVSSTTPCNQAGGDVAGGGSLDTNPWLLLKTTAIPTAICNSTPTTLGNTSSITASFLNNSDGTAIPVANLTRLIGLPLIWTSTLGNLSGQQNTVQASGTSTATFTSNGTAGTATVNAQVDNVPASETSPARENITVNATSIVPTGANGTKTICKGSSTSLTVTGGLKGSGAVTQWYTGSCGETLVFTGDVLNVSPASTITYFVRYNGTCNITTCASVTVTVNDPSVSPSSISGTSIYCNPGATTLTALGGTLGTNANYQWGTGAVPGTNPISGATNSTINISPIITTTYWIRIENTTAPCPANTGGVTQIVTVIQPSVAPTSISGTSTFCNPGSTTLTATGGTLGTGANYQWGTGDVVGTSPIVGAINSTLNVLPTTTTTYWVRIENTTAPCAINTDGVTQVVTVIQPSVAPTSISGTSTFCSPGSTTITATGGTLGTGANYQWGTGDVFGTSPIVGAINSTLNVSPTTTTTYWVRIENNTAPCAANTSGVTQVVTVIQPSIAPTSIVGSTTICSGGTTTLTATGGTLGTNAIYQWGTGTVVGTSPISGATNSTLNVSPTITTTYWVWIENTASPCTANTDGITQVVTVSLDNTISLNSAAGTNNQTVTVLTPINTISWNTTGATGATFSNLPPGVNGSWAMDVVSISGSPNIIGSYSYTVNLSGGCNGGFAGGTIDVTAVLSVKLLSFTGKTNFEKSISLQWKVAEQQDIIRYDVEESPDGLVFTNLGTVPASEGLSKSYSYIDSQPTIGNTYYRLKIVELSGKIFYSKILLVSLKSEISVMLYPNPISQKLMIEQFGTIRNKTAILFDEQGKIVQHLKLNSLNHEVDMQNCTSGVYNLRLEDGTVFKVIKQ